jgi:hypothetical protein
LWYDSLLSWLDPQIASSENTVSPMVSPPSCQHTDLSEIWKNGRLTICQHIEALLALLEILNRLLDGRKISQVDMQEF